MFRKFYIILGTLLLGSYLFAGVTGWEMERTTRQAVPVSVRNSPGGYRSYHFWHAGYHGGK